MARPRQYLDDLPPDVRRLVEEYRSVGPTFFDLLPNDIKDLISAYFESQEIGEGRLFSQAYQDNVDNERSQLEWIEEQRQEELLYGHNPPWFQDSLKQLEVRGRLREAMKRRELAQKKKRVMRVKRAIIKR